MESPPSELGGLQGFEKGRAVSGVLAGHLRWASPHKSHSKIWAPRGVAATSSPWTNADSELSASTAANPSACSSKSEGDGRRLILNGFFPSLLERLDSAALRARFGGMVGEKPVSNLIRREAFLSTGGFSFQAN